MEQPIIQRTYLTEIQLTQTPAAGQNPPFLNIPQLRAENAIIQGIQCFDSDSLATSPSALTVVSVLSGIVVTLVEASTENVYKYPCTDLLPTANSGFIRVFKNKKIDLSKSYITILNAAGLSINQSVVFNFIYKNTPGSEFK